MFVRTKKRANGKIAVQIVESIRKGTKVSQRVIRHVGQAENEQELDQLKRLADSIIDSMKEERSPHLPLFEPFKLLDKQRAYTDVPDDVKLKNIREEQRLIDGIHDIFSNLYDRLGFNRAIRRTSHNQHWNALLKTMVLARVANPASKRRTAALLERDFGIKVSVEQLYRTLDKVVDCEQDIKKLIASNTLELFNDKVNVLFFDVTTLYFESFQPDELRNFGFSKDFRFNQTQVVLALVTTTDGLPITYRLFAGNTYEAYTLLEMVDELTASYHIDKVMLVADRGMFNRANLQALADRKAHYIVAAKLKSLSGDIKQRILDPDGYVACGAQDGGLSWVKELSYRGNRLIVHYSPRRASKDASDRTRLVKRLVDKASNGQIALSKLISNRGTRKYLKVANQRVEIDEQKMEADALWDGLHGVITNVPPDQMTAVDVVGRYGQLWQIEEAFRVNKHDLRMRPIFHYTPRRIKAHVAVCFLAYALVKHALFHLKRADCHMSFEKLRNELLAAQSSVVVDVTTNRKYIVPSKTTQLQRKIYKAFSMKRREAPYVCE